MDHHSNYWCYTKISFEPILERIKTLGKKFVNANIDDPLIKPLIKNIKPSQMGKHSPLFKMLISEEINESKTTNVTSKVSETFLLFVFNGKGEY